MLKLDKTDQQTLDTARVWAETRSSADNLKMALEELCYAMNVTNKESRDTSSERAEIVSLRFHIAELRLAALIAIGRLS